MLMGNQASQTVRGHPGLSLAFIMTTFHTIRKKGFPDSSAGLKINHAKESLALQNRCSGQSKDYICFLHVARMLICSGLPGGPRASFMQAQVEGCTWDGGVQAQERKDRSLLLGRKMPVRAILNTKHWYSNQ